MLCASMHIISIPEHLRVFAFEMDNEGGFLTEAVLAKLATELFDSVVNEHVSSQLAWADEFLITMGSRTAVFLVQF